MRPVDLDAFLETLAHKSGEAILPFFRTQLFVNDKNESTGRFDPVTEADRASEAVIRRLIHENFPNHGILGEEFGDENLDAEYVWVLDPIDGTRAFICGLPVWGTLIGLMRHNSPVMGVMHQPYTGELFKGDGKQAKLKSARGIRELNTRACKRLKDAHLMSTDPHILSPNEAEKFHAVRSQAKLTRYGADCYAYAMLAAGHVDCVIETGLQPYDIVALIPIIEGAGGVVTTWDGKSARNGGRILAAATPELHEEVMRSLSSAS